LAPADAAKRVAPAEAVKSALQREIYGQGHERAELLAAAAQQSPAYAPAHWQLGQVRDPLGCWQKAEQYSASARLSAQISAYQRQRQQSADDIEGNLSVADWCESHGLKDQARAHLMRVIDLAPDHTVVRNRLGFVRRDGEWFSREELLREREQLAARLQAIVKWQAKFEDIRDGLVHRSQQRREHAQAKLQQVMSAEAVPAIEAVFAGGGEDTAIPAIDALDAIPDAAAALALTRFAAWGRTERIREAAARLLSKRDPQTFVPQVLASMYSPVISRFVAMQLPGGRIGYRHDFVREGQNKVQFVRLDTAYEREEMPNGDAANSLERALADLVQTARTREQLVQMQNAITSQVNDRLAWVLRLATGHALPPTPEEWWSWWNAQNEVYVSGSKPVTRIYNFDTRTVVDQAMTLPSQTLDCLAAGTVVWTIGGPSKIEQVRVGDLVLSQHPETGELAFKPVLKTTVRPAGPLVQIRVVGETVPSSGEIIQTSGGHPFCVSGEGWVKARNVKSGQVLHGASGPVQVSCVDPGNTAETYNLVVADFNTYFVGSERVLSHDNTPRQTTRAIVPGLVEE